MSRPLKSQVVRSMIWAGIAIGVLCALALAVLLARGAIEKEVGFWGAIALASIGILAAAGALIPLAMPEGKRLPRRVRLPAQILVGLVLVTFATLGAISDTLGLLEPRAAVESAPGAMEKQLNSISDAVLNRLPAAPEAPAAAPDRAQVESAVRGRWGERGCGVVYAFTVAGDHVIVEAVRRPPGAPPYRLSATIVGWRDNVLEVRGESPAQARGKAASFRPWTNGVDRKLVWDDPAGRGSLELVPCE